MIKEYIKYIFIFLAPTILLFTGGYIGYKYGANKTEIYYKSEINKINIKHENERAIQEQLNNELSVKYFNMQNEVDRIYDTNMQLIDQLRKQERANKQSKVNSNPKCAVKPAPCPAISANLASDITKLFKQADQAAQYAVTCREWINTLQGNKEMNKLENIGK